MERKKRSKGRGWKSCYVKKIYGTFGVEMRAYGQKLVKFCTHTHTRLSYSSIDMGAGKGCCYENSAADVTANGAAKAYRPLSRRLDRCDRVIQNESRDPFGDNVYYVTIQITFFTRKFRN